ncbi:inner membrane-spanning protein YciB [Aliikangiella coralliicola]|uniref:Inner membrane-spanning protein YciB n=1 Tax=Aliikangiella coralliicola TaxID=2592383 RepID=A0A545UDD2_9GAMM|nr:septation protein IspZ [Aliikangiella coralliicola]TQV87469.1 septation protein A [Aliikangiella coralliicola]
MKLFLDFFPLAVFVGIYFFTGAEKPIYPAVQGLMVAAVIQTIGSRLITGKFEKLHLWTLLITLVFGAFTLLFKNAAFIQWKASIVVWVMAAVFLFRQFISKKLLIQEMMQAAVEDKMEVPENIWKKINLSWPIAYIIFGFLNLYVAFNFSEAFWVNFKLFGLLALTFLLLIYTLYKLFPYFPEDDSATDSSTNIKTTNKED